VKFVLAINEVAYPSPLLGLYLNHDQIGTGKFSIGQEELAFTNVNGAVR
jgi:hypothetical protein